MIFCELPGIQVPVHALLRLVLVLPLLPALLPAQQPEPLSLDDRAVFHLKRLTGPWSLASSAFSSGIRQWRAEPPEWGGGMAGYGRRYASSYTFKAAQNVFEFGLGAAFRDDPRYRRSERTGAGRVRDAVLHSLRPAHVGSYTGAGLLTTAWYPDSRNSIGRGFARAGIGLGFSIGRNVFREFWPDIKRRVFRR